MASGVLSFSSSIPVTKSEYWRVERRYFIALNVEFHGTSVTSSSLLQFIYLQGPISRIQPRIFRIEIRAKNGMYIHSIQPLFFSCNPDGRWRGIERVRGHILYSSAQFGVGVEQVQFALTSLGNFRFQCSPGAQHPSRGYCFVNYGTYAGLSIPIHSYLQDRNALNTSEASHGVPLSRKLERTGEGWARDETSGGRMDLDASRGRVKRSTRNGIRLIYRSAHNRIGGARLNSKLALFHWLIQSQCLKFKPVATLQGYRPGASAAHRLRLPLDLPFQIPPDLSLGVGVQPWSIHHGTTAESTCSARCLGGDHDSAPREKPAHVAPEVHRKPFFHFDSVLTMLQDGVTLSQATMYPHDNMYVWLEDHKMVLGDRNMEMGKIF
ncbi:hypothetical protein B0H17DRAFT_1236042 [Mycena rosella]|uniref:Uncharacterized protein n=1 Tax=Mycena rosella TaxID=1033263 RepID=A0AAD7D467_MYCRO|nr:hypothetical protein B0H17DRAFT_1236042 [Mycena rosella]